MRDFHHGLLAHAVAGEQRPDFVRLANELEGHRRGVEIFEEIGDAAIKRGVKYMTFWGFSTENWQRSKREVAYLMKLFRWVFTNKLEDFHRKNIRVNVLGRAEQFSKDLQRMIKTAITKTQQNTRGVVNLALNYGGRAELMDMVKRALTMKLNPRSLTEEQLSRLLYAPDIPDPDLIIRTSGTIFVTSGSFFCAIHVSNFSTRTSRR